MPTFLWSGGPLGLMSIKVSPRERQVFYIYVSILSYHAIPAPLFIFSVRASSAGFSGETLLGILMSFRS